jgi:DNA-binding MarR family transcriptional regulator
VRGPAYARTAEELVFHTDTDEENYPIYLLPDGRLYHKRRPDEAEEYATFHVRGVAREEYARADEEGAVERICGMLPQLPLREVVAAASSVARPPSVRVYVLRIAYEVYKGDYAELLGEAEAPCALVEIDPPAPGGADKKQRWAVAYNTARRLQAKLPESLRGRVYVTRKKGGESPVVRVKLPAPTPELEKLFGDAVAWLRLPAPEPEAEEPPRLPAELLSALEEEAASGFAAAGLAAGPPRITIRLPEAPAAQPEPPPGPSRGELVRVYLLSMRLPSRYSAQKEVRYAKNGKGLIAEERRIFDGVAPRLESIRRSAYARIERVFAYTPEFGVWIAVTEEAVEEARKVSEFVKSSLRRLGLPEEFAARYDVRAIKVYLEPEDAKALLQAAVEHLSKDVEELEAKIEEAKRQQAQRALRRLMATHEFRKTLLEVLKKHLQQIS